MKQIIFSLYNNTIADAVATNMNIEIGRINFRSFPDKESYLKIETSVKDKEIIVIDSLNDPNKKILPLLYFSKTAKELGAKRIGLVAPYLAYLRQDKQFNSGEGITSRYFSEIISNHFDWLLTIDPHLHRYHDLSEIYSIPSKVIHTSAILADWISKNVELPLLIGPDIESKQWVADIANSISASCLILKKVRLSDDEVEISMPNLERYQKHTPVLIDDIISTAHTMLTTIDLLKNKNKQSPICIGIHGIFANESYQELLNTNAGMVVSCNTIAHESNQINVANLVSKELEKFLSELA